MAAARSPARSGRQPLGTDFAEGAAIASPSSHGGRKCTPSPELPQAQLSPTSSEHRRRVSANECINLSGDDDGGAVSAPAAKSLLRMKEPKPCPAAVAAARAGASPSKTTIAAATEPTAAAVTGTVDKVNGGDPDVVDLAGTPAAAAGTTKSMKKRRIKRKVPDEVLDLVNALSPNPSPPASAAQVRRQGPSAHCQDFGANSDVPTAAVKCCNGWCCCFWLFW
jgi:hypothetical protein